MVARPAPMFDTTEANDMKRSKLLIFAAIIIVSGAGVFLYLWSQEKQSNDAAKTEQALAEPSPPISERWNTYRDVARSLEFKYPESYRLQWGVNGVLLKKAEQTIAMRIDETGYNFKKIYERAASPDEFVTNEVSSTYAADGPDSSQYATLPKKYSFKTPNGLDAIELYLTIVNETYLEEGKTTEERTEVPIYIVSISQEPYRSFLSIRYLDHERGVLEKGILRKIADSVKVWVLLPPPHQAQADDIRHVCETKLTERFKQWRFATVKQGVAEFARERHENPTITYGDFDDDARRDVALLIQNDTNPEPDDPRRGDSLHIAVCLNTKAGPSLYLINRPYCGDGITLSPKGRTYYDFETKKEGTYKLDGVHAYCFEKAGATYEFENGLFRRIVDSD